MARERRYAFKRFWKRWLAAGMDAAGAWLVQILRLFRVISSPRYSPRRILALRMDHIGDAVMAWPAVTALHERFPEAEIDFLTSEETAPLFESAPILQKVISFKTSWFGRKNNFRDSLEDIFRLAKIVHQGAYDLAIDFRGDVRIALALALAGVEERVGYGITGGGFLFSHCGHYDFGVHQVDLNFRLLEPFGVTRPSLPVPLPYSEAKSHAFWQKWGPALGDSGRPRVIIHPGSRMPSKRWSSEKFQALIRKLLDQKLGRMFIIGSESEIASLPLVARNDSALCSPFGDSALCSPLFADSHRQIRDASLRSGAEAISDLIDMRGQTKLNELPILMDSCDLFIGCDSGPAHLAACQGLEVVSLFSGTNRSSVWRPWTDKLHLIEHANIEKITVEEVIKCVRDILSGSSFPHTNSSSFPPNTVRACLPDRQG